MPASDAAVMRASPMTLAEAYGLPADLVVHVVELPDAGDAGERHLGVRRSGQGQQAVGIQPVRDGVHPVAPGPERAVRGLAAATQRAVEGVAVHVGEAGEHQTGQPLGLGRHPGDPGLDRSDDAVVGGDHDA